MKDKTSDPTVLSLLSQIEGSLTRLHGLLLQLEHRTMEIESPLPVGPWADTATDPKVHEKMGAIGVLLALYCSQRWDGFLRIILSKAHDLAPLRADAIIDSMASGMADAALACPCGACPYCLLKAESSATLARPEIVKQMKANVMQTLQQSALAAGAQQGQEVRKIHLGN